MQRLLRRLRFASGLAPGERAVEALLEAGDEARRAERPPGALAGPDRRMVDGIEAGGEERRPIRCALQERARADEPVILAREMRLRARPAPVARLPREPGADRGELDLT